jgi:predicted nucleic acid binding AN1-type Zn finger protein
VQEFQQWESEHEEDEYFDVTDYEIEDESEIDYPGPDDCDDCGAYIATCQHCGRKQFHKCAAGESLRDYCECEGGMYDWLLRNED